MCQAVFVCHKKKDASVGKVGEIISAFISTKGDRCFAGWGVFLGGAGFPWLLKCRANHA